MKNLSQATQQRALIASLTLTIIFFTSFSIYAIFSESTPLNSPITYKTYYQQSLIWIFAIVNTIALPIIFFLCWSGLKNDFKSFWKYKTKNSCYIIGSLTIALLLTIVTYYFSTSIFVFNNDLVKIEATYFGEGFWLVLIFVIANPILECLIFLGLIQNNGKQSGKWLTIMRSTLILAILPAITDLTALSAFFPIAFVLSYSYYQTNNIWVPITIKIIFNTIAYLTFIEYFLS